MSKTSGIPLIIYEGLKKIKEICDPELFPPLFESLNKSINNLQQMIENNNFKHYGIEAKPFFDVFALIVESMHSLPQRQTLPNSDIKLFDSFQRIIFNTFYLIFSQSSPDNYPKHKMTSFIIKTMLHAQFEISLDPNASANSDSNIENFEFLVAKVCHACFNSISGALYVHGPAVRKLLELMYRCFSCSKKQEIRDKIQSLIEDVIILLFNRYCEPDPLPRVLDENFESLSRQIAKNLISNSMIIHTFSEFLLPPKSYSTRIIEIDLYVLISFFCRASEMIFFNFYPMAFAIHYLLTALSIKSEFFNSTIFKILLNKYISQTVIYSFLNRQDLFKRPGIDLLLTIYRLFPENFTGSFQSVLMNGLYTALNSPTQRAKSKAMSIFSSILSERHFFPDIFANLDCGKYYSNVFRDLTEVIVENCYPKQKYRQMSTEIIKNILEMMKDFLAEMHQLEIKENERQDDILREKNIFNNYYLFMKGVSIFKNSPEKGVKFFIDNKFIEQNNPESVSNFLFNCKKLDKYQIAMFLTENLNFEYLNFFMKNYSFKKTKFFDESLRIFLSHLSLPKEESRADMLLTIFGNLYIHTKGRFIFSSADAVVAFTKKILSFQSFEQRINVLQERGLSSIISLNEKGNSPSNTRLQQNVTKSSALQVPPFDKFIELMKGINDGANLPIDFLKPIHFNISVAPIILAPLEKETNEINRTNRNNNNQNPASNESLNRINNSSQNISNSSALNLNNNTTNSTNLNDSRNSSKKMTESEESPPIQVKYSHSENSIDESQINQNENQNKNRNQSQNSNEISNGSFMQSLAFFDPDILIRNDRNIEWYLCKCNQSYVLSKLQQVHEETFFHCKTSYVIRPMFESIWGGIHGSIAANIEASNDEETAAEYIDNLQLCIHVAARSHAEEALTILMTSLATFAGLLNPVYRSSFNAQNQTQTSNWKLTQKNVACFKRMLIIATEEADYLSPVWHIFIDQLSLLDLYKPSKLIDDSEITDSIENFFHSSHKYKLSSAIALIKAMIKVCNKELSEKPEKRLSMIQKLVLVAQYNMKRNNKEWSQIWEIIGNNYLSYIIALADSKNDILLSKKVIDYIRYLSLFFLQLVEDPKDNYQYNFMMTFLIIFQEQCSERSQIYLLESIFMIIKKQSISIRSGWAMIFEILTLATAEPHTQEIAFKILTDLVNNQIVVENPIYVIHLISFIATFSRNANSIAPIPFYEKVCDKLTINANSENVESIKNMWIELFQSISRSSRSTRIEIKKATNESYLTCLIILAEKYNIMMTNNSFDQEFFPTMMNSIWEFAITNTFEDMSFAELDKFLIKYDEKFIHKYADLLGDNTKHIINILILSVFKDGSESGRINKNSNTNINADVAIQILLNLVSQKIDQSTKDFVISLLTQTVKKVPTLSLDHARSYVYLLNQFSKLFKDSKKEFIEIFTKIGNAMINSSNSDAIKRNVVCALARESLLVEIQDCDTDFLDETQKAKMINETFEIYLNSGFTQSAESLAGAEWMRVICLSLKMVNSIEENDRFSTYFDVMAKSLLEMIESSSKEIRNQLGVAVERKLLL